MMLQKLTLAATAAAFLALAMPAEAAMPGPGPHPGGYAAGHVTPVKAKKKVIYVKKKVCHPVYKWRWTWWRGHPAKVKVKVGETCAWRWVPVWRWH